MRGASIAGDEVEHPGCVAAQRRIASEKGQVGINLGGNGMVIAGPEMDIGAQKLALSPRDQRDLGMCLQIDKAEDDLSTGLFQSARPANVALFVKPRLKLYGSGRRLPRHRHI